MKRLWLAIVLTSCVRPLPPSPDLRDYFVGEGWSDVSDGGQARERAKMRALADLARNASVRIRSESTDAVKEKNGVSLQESASTITANADFSPERLDVEDCFAWGKKFVCRVAVSRRRLQETVDLEKEAKALDARRLRMRMERALQGVALVCPDGIFYREGTSWAGSPPTILVTRNGQPDAFPLRVDAVTFLSSASGPADVPLPPGDPLYPSRTVIVEPDPSSWGGAITDDVPQCRIPTRPRPLLAVSLRLTEWTPDERTAVEQGVLSALAHTAWKVEPREAPIADMSDAPNLIDGDAWLWITGRVTTEPHPVIRAVRGRAEATGGLYDYRNQRWIVKETIGEETTVEADELRVRAVAAARMRRRMIEWIKRRIPARP